MKIVINKQHGGFNLSPSALKAYADLKGKDCYFFKLTYEEHKPKYIPLSLEQANQEYWTSAFTVPNPLEVAGSQENFSEMTMEERCISNEKWDEIILDERIILRNDPDLIKVIEDIGEEKASGQHSTLKIVEIPDDVDWEIQEYDGLEWVAEKHRTWG